MATLLAHVQIKEGFESEFEAIAREMYAATHAHEDVVRYEYWRSRTPGLYYVTESFADHEGFLRHQASPHHEQWAPRLREIMASIDIEWVDPLPEAAPLRATHLSRPAEHELTERYPLQIAPWWTTS